MKNISSGMDWKEVRITGTVTLLTAFAGCLAAVVVTQVFTLPAIDKAKAKKETTR